MRKLILYTQGVLFQDVDHIILKSAVAFKATCLNLKIKEKNTFFIKTKS